MHINCAGNLVDLSTPKVMGILNLTPDSFYDGGKYKNIKQALLQVEKMLSDGASFIDMGAYSSKPGAEDISVEDELGRLMPVLLEVRKHFPESYISVDTFRSKVAKAAIEEGASIINDISAGSLDEEMLQTVANAKVPYVLMHMRGTPQTMKQLASYTDIIEEMNLYFSEKLQKARNLGINDCIIDPGFGFAKTLEQNYRILQHLSAFHFHEVPVLVGVSRKSMIYKLLESSPDKALNGSTVLHTIALQKNAHILRVHDVKEAVEAIELLAQLNKEVNT